MYAWVSHSRHRFSISTGNRWLQICMTLCKLPVDVICYIRRPCVRPVSEWIAEAWRGISNGVQKRHSRVVSASLLLIEPRTARLFGSSTVSFLAAAMAETACRRKSGYMRCVNSTKVAISAFDLGYMWACSVHAVVSYAQTNTLPLGMRIGWPVKSVSTLSRWFGCFRIWPSDW